MLLTLFYYFFFKFSDVIHSLSSFHMTAVINFFMVPLRFTKSLTYQLDVPQHCNP